MHFVVVPPGYRCLSQENDKQEKVGIKSEPIPIQRDRLAFVIDLRQGLHPNPDYARIGICRRTYLNRPRVLYLDWAIRISTSSPKHDPMHFRPLGFAPRRASFNVASAPLTGFRLPF